MTSMLFAVIGVLLTLMVIISYRKKIKKPLLVAQILVASLLFCLVVAEIENVWLMGLADLLLLVLCLTIVHLFGRGILGPKNYKQNDSKLERFGARYPRLSISLAYGIPCSVLILKISFPLMVEWTPWGLWVIVGYDGSEAWLRVLLIWSGATASVVAITSLFVRDRIALATGVGLSTAMLVIVTLSPLPALYRACVAVSCIASAFLCGKVVPRRGSIQAQSSG